MTLGTVRTTALLAAGALTLAGCGGHNANAPGAAANGTPTPTTPSATPSTPARTPSATRTPTSTPTQTPTSTPSSTPTPAQTGTSGLPPIISKIQTTNKVVFITVDDGWEKDDD